MARRGLRVALIGATGAVGSEILEVLEERRFPATDLVALASVESAGDTIEFRGEPETLDTLEPGSLAGCDLVFCAAPGVLPAALDEIEQQGCFLVDLSGALEGDAAVPLYLPGGGPLGSRWVAIPRGVAAALGMALGTLSSEVEITRVTAVTCESASGAGRDGPIELADHTATILTEMTGDRPDSDVFPASLAFDCLPLVGEAGEAGASTAERDLTESLRRMLGVPGLPIELTRMRVPVFSGSLVAVHVALSHAIDVDRARELWSKRAGLRVLAPDELPTSRGALGQDDVLVGRVRPGREDAPSLAFALAIDDLRRGSALAAVEAAELLIG